MRVLLIANLGDDDPGYVGPALVARGGRIDVAHRDGDAALPDPESYDVVVSLGSDWSVYWPHVADHVTREETLLRSAVESGTPVLGICFGAQILAHALGGGVERAPVPEVGWYAVDSDAPDLIPPGPYLQWHWDRFRAPAGSLELARSPVGAQAFVRGSGMGVQFHPEATPAILRRWSAGISGVIDGTETEPAAIIAEAEVRDDEARERADRIVATFLSGVLAGRTASAGR